MAACALHRFPEDHGSLKLEGGGGVRGSRQSKVSRVQSRRTTDVSNWRGEAADEAAIRGVGWRVRGGAGAAIRAK